MLMAGNSGCGKSTFIRSLNRMHEVIDGAYVEGEVILNGLKAYNQEVKDKSFPGEENYFGMKDEEFEELTRSL